MEDEVFDDGAESAFVFEGNWREYAPIAFSNLLLTIVTLGIYRFWGTARTRRYLWSRTRFVDEHLEWSGTGKELFLGFLLVLVLFAVPYFGLTFLAQSLILQGYQVLGGALIAAAFVLIFYLGGVARFRALRYRLSRTHWHGIRGGSDDQGFAYGLSYMWRTIVGWLPLGLMIPWSMTTLWNERWRKMSYGPYAFESDADPGEVFGRFLLFYLAPILIFALGLFVMFSANFLGNDSNVMAVMMGVFGLGVILFFYFGLGLIAVAFFAKFYRVALGTLRWRGLEFSFTASTMGWIKLFVVDVLLVIGTLGIGIIFLPYRHWKFMITHLEASGEILLDELTQSTTRTSEHGEGLLDAFDVGAF